MIWPRHYGGHLLDAVSAPVAWLAVGLLAAAVGIGASACGRTPLGPAQRVSSDALKSSPHGTFASYAIPDGPSQGEWAALVPDPDGHAVWWWAVDDRSDAHVYRFDVSTHAVDSWSLGNASAEDLVPGYTGPGIGSGGIVWVAGGTKLARLDTTSGAVEILDVPPVGSDAATDARPPGEVAGVHEIVGLAAGADGDVTVVTDRSPQLPVYRSTTRTWRYLSLPAGMTALDAGVLDDGTLGVAVAPPDGPVYGSVLLIRRDGSTATLAGLDTAFVVAASNRFLVGGERLSWVYGDGRTVPAGRVTIGEEFLAYPSTHPAWPLPDNRVAIIGTGELGGLVILSEGHPPEPVMLPERPCPPQGAISGGSPGLRHQQSASSTTTTTSAPVCRVGIGALTTIDRTVWFVQPDPDGARIWRVGV